MNDTEKNEIERIKKLLLPVFMESKTKKAYLFGSFSKGTQTRKSDVDLMIITETDKRFFNRYDDYEKIQQILADQSVDMLIYRFYITTRYPNGLPELTPEEAYLEEDAKNCIENAKKIIKAVKSIVV